MRPYLGKKKKKPFKKGWWSGSKFRGERRVKALSLNPSVGGNNINIKTFSKVGQSEFSLFRKRFSVVKEFFIMANDKL
jgi:hypothetical protein